jgi:hypothetical protein
MADRELQRMAMPTSWSADNKTASVVVSTDADIGDGVLLVHTRAAIQWPSRPLPVVLDHRTTVDAVIGAITELRLEQQSNGSTALVGQLVLDGPAAGQAEPLLRTGAARWSVGARIHQLKREPGSGLERAISWSPLHLALVVEPADPQGITRSNQTNLKNMSEVHTQAATQAAETDNDEQLSRSELKRQRDIFQVSAAAGLNEAETAELIRSGRSVRECSIEAVRQFRIRTEGNSVIGHPAQGAAALPLSQSALWAGSSSADRDALVRSAQPATAATEPADPLARAIHRAVRGQSLERPLVDELRAAGYAGRSGEELARSAFATGKRNSNLLRGFHSSSDARELLIETGDRRLQERHSEAPRGILELARIRTLSDFREASVIDAGLVGGAVKLEEGAEIKYGSLNSEAGKYKPSRYGLGLSFTFEALQNDDLGGIDAVLNELSATMLESESSFVGELLFGSAGEGGICPDGLALFDVAHGNTPATDATLSTQGLSAMVELLRRQTSVGGRKIWLSPGYVLVGPDLETTALQLLSEAWQATEPDDTNPWKSLRLIVDPTVEEGYFYLAAAGGRKPFEIGRVDGMPQMRQEEDFNTSGMRMKVEHAYGGACTDHRVIVRNKRIPE